jgi:hypothetical protein
MEKQENPKHDQSCFQRIAPQPVAQTTAQPAAPPASSQAKPQVSTTDTVQISQAARAMMREAIQNPAQTAKEAAARGPSR